MRQMLRYIFVIALSAGILLLPPVLINAKTSYSPATTKLTLSAVTYNSIKLNYKKVNSVAGYRIYRSSKPLTGYKLVNETMSLSYIDTDLLPNTKYYYKVKTYKIRNRLRYYSKYSNQIIATTKFDTPSISQKGYDSAIIISIKKTVAGAQKYRIYRSTDGRTYGYIGETAETTYNDAKDIQANKTYYYKIRGTRVVNNKTYYTPYSYVTLGKTSNRVLGIDVSHYQNDIDWKQVKASGVTFAMIKAGGRGYDTGIIYEDAKFKTNIIGAISAGIKVGIYFYSTSMNETEAIAEANWLVKAIKPYNITYPVAFDWEEWGKHRTKNVTGEQVTKNAIAFSNIIDQAGYEPIIYASKLPYMNKYDRTQLEQQKYWLAHYTTDGADSDYKGSYYMWQYTSSGFVPGINTRVDMNVVMNYVHTHNFDTISGFFLEDGYVIKKCKCGLTEKVFIETTPTPTLEPTLTPTITPEATPTPTETPTEETSNTRASAGGEK